MFILKPDHTVSWPAEIPMPSDGGTVTKISVDVTYKLLDTDVYDTVKHNDLELLKTVLVGWSKDAFGVKGKKDEAEPLEFNQENLASLLKFPYVRTGLIQGYWQAQAGLEKN